MLQKCCKNIPQYINSLYICSIFAMQRYNAQLQCVVAMCTCNASLNKKPELSYSPGFSSTKCVATHEVGVQGFEVAPTGGRQPQGFPSPFLLY